ncbi:PAS domain-containing protein [Alkalinema pantanalense CENA528]|uniref:PAS domain-containing protein n=1 Tax=Alkalinema pantanalense TaxID=1620705 RepID=UPI003D6EE9C4
MTSANLQLAPTERVHQLERSLRLLRACNRALIRAQEEYELLQTLCQLIVDLGEYRLAWVGYAHQDAEKTVQPVAYAGYEADYLQNISITWAETAWGLGPTGKAIRSGQPCAVQDLQNETDYGPWQLAAQQRGYRASIALPLIQDQQVFGALNIYAPTINVFQTEEIELLTELADDLSYGISVLRQIKKHNQVQQALEFQVTLDQLIAQVTHSFIQAQSQDINPLINAALQEIGDFTQVESTYVFRYSEDHQSHSMTHEWVAVGIAPQIHRTQNLPVAQFPWSTLQLQQGNVVYITNLNSLPPEADLDRQNFQNFGLQSLLAIPLKIHGQILGFVGFSSFHHIHFWSENNIRLLQIFTDILANVLQQQQAELAWQISERRYQSLAEAAPVGIFRTDAEGHCIYVNDRWSQMTGLPPEAALGKGWVACLHPDDRDRVVSAWQQIIQTKCTYQQEYRFQHTSGELYWVYGQAIAEYNTNGDVIGYIGTIVDITNQKQTEIALKIQRDFNQLITEITGRFIELNPTAVDAEINRTLQLIGEISQSDTSYLFQYDEGSRTSSMTHEWVKSGYPPQMTMAQNIACWDLFPWSSPKLMQRETVYVSHIAELPPEAAIDQANWQSLGLTSVVMIPLLQRSEVIGVIGFASFSRPIRWETEAIRLLQVMGQIIVNSRIRISTEQQLQESEERLRLALSAANQGLYDLNLQTGEALVNPEYATMLGYDPATFVENNTQWIDRLHLDDRASVTQVFQDYITGTIPEYKVEFRQRTQAGDWKWILSLGKIVAWDENGTPLRMLGTHTDITDRKRTEEERLRSTHLQNELKLLENLLDTVLAGYWDWDIANHTEYMSPGLKKMLGYENDELANVPETWQTLIFQEDLAKVFENFDQHVQSHGAIPYCNEVRYHHKDGSTVWVICAGRVIEWDAVGKPLRMIGSHVDITDSKRAQEILRTNEERLQLALEGSGDGLWDWNIITDAVYLSPRWLEMLGYSVGELPGHVNTWQHLIHPDDAAHVLATLQAHLKDSSIPYAFEYRMQHRSGEWRWIANYGKVVSRDAAGTPSRMVGIHRDITDRKQAEAALKESEARFRYLADHAPVLMLMTDANQHCIHFNQRWLKFTGRTLDQEVNHGWTDGIHPSDRALCLQTYANAFKTHQPFELEYRLRQFDGQYRWLLFTGVPRFDPNHVFLGYILSGTDITARKQAETQVLRLNTTLENALEGISQLTLEGHYVQVNQAYAEICGYTPEQLIGQPWQRTVHPDDLPSLELAYQTMLEQGKATVEARGIRQNGSQFYKEVALVLAHNEKGQLIGHYCFMKDITARKQAEEQLQQVNRELQRSNQELEQFAYIASHDLQEPLRAIIGYTQLLEEAYTRPPTPDLDPRTQEYMTFIIQGAKRMRSLIQDLLTYSRVGSRPLTPVPTDCNEILVEVCNSLQVAISEHKASIICDPLPTLWIDRTQVMQLFQNLIGNAIKFNQANNPQVHIRVSEFPADPTRCDPRSPPEHHWRFSVQDNGIGIQPKYLDRIFEIFRRLHSQQKFPGTGIGLAICRKIIERHGGEIWVESEPGNGTTFYFTLSDLDTTV